MSSKRIGRRMLAVAGGVALITLGTTTAACGTSGNQAPPSTSTTPSTTTTTSSTPPPSPTEKSVSPTGGNLFTPPVRAPGAPTVAPGQHPGINGIP
jgi:hypothetical protein